MSEDTSEDVLGNINNSYFHNICFLDELDTSDHFWKNVIFYYIFFHNFNFFLNEAFPKLHQLG